MVSNYVFRFDLAPLPVSFPGKNYFTKRLEFDETTVQTYIISGAEDVANQRVKILKQLFVFL